MSPTIPLPPLSRRKSPESPVLWLILLASSLLLNLVSVLGLGQVFRQMEPVALDFEPIAVEFVASGSPNTAKPSSTQPGRSAPTSPAIAATPQAAPPPTQTTVAAPPAANQKADLAFVERPTPKPTPATQPTPKQTTPPPQPRSQGSRQPSPSTTTQPTVPANTTAQPDSQAQTTVASTTSTATKPGPVESGVLLPGLPAVPDANQNKPPEDSIQGAGTRPVPVSHQALPAKFVVTVKAIAPTSSQLTASASLAIAPPSIQGSPTKTFTSDASTCLLPPEAVRQFDQPITLQVPLDSTGQIAPQAAISVQVSSGNDSYDNLAICALQSWRFSPASSIESDQTHPMPSQLTVQVTITSPAE